MSNVKPLVYQHRGYLMDENGTLVIPGNVGPIGDPRACSVCGCTLEVGAEVFVWDDDSSDTVAHVGCVDQRDWDEAE